ncbi:MAG: Gfo/Idh/MocA family oxidoreductase [Tolypothrix brevis GSE-NOS-MK-07-07A]|nr:Gfo/Idh/MocA family oxidoreductase [Tolypothrix brevis GSE-NOS-MK-07-07A]
MLDLVKSELTRRTLLHQAGFGLITLGIVPAIFKPTPTLAQTAKEPPMPPEKKLGWAVVGLGKFATQQIIPSFAECKRSKLVALVSGDRTKAEQYAQQYGVNPKNIYNYQNYDTIRDNPEVDVI